MPKHNTRKRKYLLPGKNLIKGKAEVKTLHLAGDAANLLI